MESTDFGPHPVTVGYWDIRGLVEPIRMILHYKKVPYNYVTYTMDERGKNHPEWQEAKTKLGLSFPNLPFYFDQDVKLSQSGAILSYLGKRLGLGGTNAVEEAEIAEVADLIKLELHYFFFLTCYSDRFEMMKHAAVGQARGVFKQFDHFLSKEGKHWLFGDRLTYPDFHFWSMLDAYSILEPTVLDGCDRVKAYKVRFEEIPEVKGYLSKNEFNKYQLCHKIAAFGGTGVAPE